MINDLWSLGVMDEQMVIIQYVYNVVAEATTSSRSQSQRKKSTDGAVTNIGHYHDSDVCLQNATPSPTTTHACS
jgi:hypothetical protein